MLLFESHILHVSVDQKYTYININNYSFINREILIMLLVELLAGTSGVKKNRREKSDIVHDDLTVVLCILVT